MLGIINNNINQTFKAFKSEKNSQPKTNIKFNTGQPVQDTVSFGSKYKKQDRIAYAIDHDFQLKYGIKPEDTNSLMIRAHCVGLDPREATDTMIKAVRLGLDKNTDAKIVREEPHRRGCEVDAKLLGIQTQGKDFKALNSEIKEKKCQIHREVAELVLAQKARKLPENYKPLAYPDFSSAIETDATIAETLTLLGNALGPENKGLDPIVRVMTEGSDLPDMAMEAAEKLRGEGEKPMSEKRKLDLQSQIEVNNWIEETMQNLFRARCAGINNPKPDMKQVEAIEHKAHQLTVRGQNWRRENFDARLAEL